MLPEDCHDTRCLKNEVDEVVRKVFMTPARVHGDIARIRVFTEVSFGAIGS